MGSRCLLNLRGTNDVKLEESTVSQLYVDGFTNISAENLAVITLNMSSSASVEIHAKPLAHIKILGLDNWTIQRTNSSLQIGSIQVHSGSVILSFQNYSVISTVGLKNDTVLFNRNVDQDVVRKLNSPNILVARNNSFIEYFSESFTVSPIKHAYAFDTVVNVTIPYQTSRQLDFFGNGTVNIVNEMISCGIVANCDLFAHRNCTEAVRVCKW